jgi:hypothetical protein
MFIYIAVMVFVLWISSVIESFVPPGSGWLIIILQAFFVIKVTLILGLLLIPLLLFFKNPLIIGLGSAAILIILIRLLVMSNIAVMVPK